MDFDNSVYRSYTVIYKFTKKNVRSGAWVVNSASLPGYGLDVRGILVWLYANGRRNYIFLFQKCIHLFWGQLIHVFKWCTTVSEDEAFGAWSWLLLLCSGEMNTGTASSFTVLRYMLVILVAAPCISSNYLIVYHLIPTVWVSWKAGNFLTSCKPVSFSRRTLHHGVSK